MMNKQIVKTVSEVYSAIDMLAYKFSDREVYFYQSGLDLIDIWARQWRHNVIKLKFLGTHNFTPKEGVNIIVLWDFVEDLEWLEILLSEGDNYILLSDTCHSYTKAPTVYD